MAAEKIDPPLDKLNLVYIIFGWLGVGTLLPWNFFITVNEYWSYKFACPESLKSSNDSSAITCTGSIDPNWGPNMSMASMIPNVTFLLLNAVFGHRFKTVPRLLVSLICVIVLFAFTCAMAKIDTSHWQDQFWQLTIASIVLINVTAAIFQGKLNIANKQLPVYKQFQFLL